MGCPVAVSFGAGRMKIGHSVGTERVQNFPLRNAVIHTRGSGNGYPSYAGFASEDAWRLISSTTARILSRKEAGASICPQPACV